MSISYLHFVELETKVSKTDLKLRHEEVPRIEEKALHLNYQGV